MGRLLRLWQWLVREWRWLARERAWRRRRMSPWFAMVIHGQPRSRSAPWRAITDQGGPWSPAAARREGMAIHGGGAVRLWLWREAKEPRTRRKGRAH